MSAAESPIAPVTPFALAPDYRARVWGGTRLRAATLPIGELWAVYDENRIVDGPWAGLTLGEATVAAGPALLGDVAAGCAERFPLLIKLLDTADWLSVQVHPDDEQARWIEGANARGKAEAWYVLDAAPGAALIGGVRAGTAQATLQAAIRGGGLLDLAERRQPLPGETFLLEPGAIHALGPGLLLYEVQQPSDITYRVYDWDRPASDGRTLHVEQSAAVARADRVVAPIAPPALPDGGRARLLRTPWFALDLLRSATRPVALDTGGAAVHALTAIEGDADLRGDGWRRALPHMASVVVPAACGAYEVVGRGGSCRVLLAMP